MRNPHAGVPFDTSDDEIAAALARRQHPDAAAVAGPHDRRPVAHPRPAAARGAVPQRGPGLHDRGGQGRGPRDSPSRSSATTATAAARSPSRSRPSCSSEMMDWLVVRGRARRVRADAARGDGARRRRRPPGRPRPSRRRGPRGVPRRGHRLRPVGPARRRSACRRPASRSRSSRRTPGSAAPGGRTPIPAPASTSATTSTATASSPPTTGPSTSRSNPSCRRTSTASWPSTASTDHVRFDTEVARRGPGTTTTRRGRCGSAPPTAPRTTLDGRARSSPPSASSTGPTIPRHPRRGHLCRTGVPLRALGPRRRPHRQGVGHDRCRRQRLPDRAGHRRRGRAASRSSSAPRSGCSRTPTTTRTVGPGVQLGDRAPAVLRPLVPVPAVLARLRQGSRRRTRRPRLARPAARGQRVERPGPPDVHRLDHQPGRRRPRAARQGRPRLPGHGQAHPAGQRQLAADAQAATTSSWFVPASTTSSPTPWSTVDGTPPPVPTCSSTPPGSAPTSSSRRCRSLGRDGIDLRSAGGAAGRLPRHHGARLPELLLHVRPRHQPGQRRQPDLPLRVPDALHHELPRAADRTAAPRRWSRAGTATTTGTTAPRPKCETLVWSQPSIEALLLQERVRRDPRAEPVAARRLLVLDPRTTPADFVVN